MWIFLDVPDSEAELAERAGAEYHRKRGLWFFDDKKYNHTDFARWRRATPVEEAQATPQDPAQALLSLHEAAILSGHTAKIIRALVEADRFPKPIVSAGKSSRSDRWGMAQVLGWVERNGFGALTRGQGDTQTAKAGAGRARSQAFYSIAEIAEAANIPRAAGAFKILKKRGILIESTEASLNLRPADEYMRYGWFARVERFLPSKNEWILQTVVTAMGYGPVLEILIGDAVHGRQ